EMMAIAGDEVGAGLGDADDRLARAQLPRRYAEVEIALDIERRHAGVVRVVEPLRRAQAPSAAFAAPVRRRFPALGFHSILAMRRSAQEPHVPCSTMRPIPRQINERLCKASSGARAVLWRPRQRARSSTG